MIFTTFLPLKRNDGALIRRSEHLRILQETWQRFGGYTLGPNQDGAWLDPISGRVYFDKTRPLIVACERSDPTSETMGH
jgi:hypothetical protein